MSWSPTKRGWIYNSGASLWVLHSRPLQPIAYKEDLHRKLGNKPLHDRFVSPQAEIFVLERDIDDYTVVLGNTTDSDILVLTAERSTRIQPFLTIELQSSQNDMVTLA